MFLVQRRMCKTCIYRPDTSLDLAKLEADVADGHGGFRTYRQCHYSETACCRGFWDKHKDRFQVGQLAQRLNFVEFVDHDTWKDVP